MLNQRIEAIQVRIAGNYMKRRILSLNNSKDARHRATGQIKYVVQLYTCDSPPHLRDKNDLQNIPASLTGFADNPHP